MDLDQDKIDSPEEAQMEDARASTSSQMLASSIDTFIECLEADITAISVVRPESLSTGNNRNIPVSIKEPVYGSKAAGVELLPSLWIGTMNSYPQVKKLMGPEKMEDLLKGWTSISCKVQVQQIKDLLKNQRMLSEDQKKKLSQGKDNSPVEAPQVSKSKSLPQQVPKKGEQIPKSNQKGKKKANPKWNKPYPQNYRIPKKDKIAMDNVLNMARTLMEFKNKEEERMNQSFPRR
ncbi:hypothetical protein O181_131945 [Austropuccinia psidii MF-1]|uniref:Uncharacterized protein n=1 Tax=Austropuccinia psidii MF-1 TaxID=1389203 RepID=A0A9Q3L1Y0_9BASI|nr:hypothetical protein [Austropuccinia psidii MF-1]